MDISNYSELILLIGTPRSQYLLNGITVIMHTVLKSGVRQGGVLSPVLFNIYISSVIKSLRTSDLGCHIQLQGVYRGCLVYADDIILLSVSVSLLQKMFK